MEAQAVHTYFYVYVIKLDCRKGLCLMNHRRMNDSVPPNTGYRHWFGAASARTLTGMLLARHQCAWIAVLTMRKIKVPGIAG